MSDIREKAIAASKAARQSWLTTHLGRGQDILDQAIADGILAIPEVAAALEQARGFSSYQEAIAYKPQGGSPAQEQQS